MQVFLWNLAKFLHVASFSLVLPAFALSSLLASSSGGGGLLPRAIFHVALIPFSTQKYRGTAPDDVADFLYKSSARYDRVPGASRGIHSFNFTRDFRRTTRLYSETNYLAITKSHVSMMSFLNTIFVKFRVTVLSFPFTNILRKRRESASLNYGKSRNITRLESINKRMLYELTSKSFIKLPFCNL